MSRTNAASCRRWRCGICAFAEWTFWGKWERYNFKMKYSRRELYTEWPKIACRRIKFQSSVSRSSYKFKNFSVKITESEKAIHLHVLSSYYSMHLNWIWYWRWLILSWLISFWSAKRHFTECAPHQKMLQWNSTFYATYQFSFCTFNKH